MRAQLANTPAEIVVANHCYGLFELAAIYLSQTPPMMFQARLPIDALGYILDGLKGRLGESEPALHADQARDMPFFASSHCAFGSSPST